MGAIHLLDDALITKIAAGEVIERPAAAVKELLENSLDAGATDIRIEVWEAGRRKIKITDNGCGMSYDDAMLCCKRHATSKIKSEEDLNAILSFGFRGEALASVAEISHLKITTKTNDSIHGTHLEIEGGKQIKAAPCGCPDGTTIEIGNLFFNVPARKKFLKSDAVELNHIIAAVTKYALSNYGCAFALIHDGRVILRTAKTDKPIDAIAAVYGNDVAQSMLKVQYTSGGVVVAGFIGRPTLTRADAADQSLYVNGRAITNRFISEAISEGYGTLLFTNRHPVFVINITVPPNLVDVNVHPKKSYVRFRHDFLIKQIVRHAVRSTLQENNLVAHGSVEKETSQRPIHQYSFTPERQSTLALMESSANYGTHFELQMPAGELSDAPDALPAKKLGPFYVLGQFNKTYIVAESPHGMVIFDQHAVEERVNYEKFLEQKMHKAIKKQGLITAKVLSVNPLQYATALKFQKYLDTLGFAIEDFGENSIKISGVPQIFGRLRDEIFFDLLNSLAQLTGDVVTLEIESRIIRFSCRASVKAGQELTKPQMNTLLDNLLLTKNPYTCPHGRPTMILFSVADMEKKFKRVV